MPDNKLHHRRIKPNKSALASPIENLKRSFPSMAGILQRATVDPDSLTPVDLQHLQRTIGNKATGQLLTYTAGTAPTLSPLVNVQHHNAGMELSTQLQRATVHVTQAEGTITPGCGCPSCSGVQAQLPASTSEPEHMIQRITAIVTSGTYKPKKKQATKKGKKPTEYSDGKNHAENQLLFDYSTGDLTFDIDAWPCNGKGDPGCHTMLKLNSNKAKRKITVNVDTPEEKYAEGHPDAADPKKGTITYEAGEATYS